MVETDEALLTTVETQLLHPEVVQQAIRETVAQLSAAATPPARAEALREELSTLTAKLDRLTQAVVLGGDLPTLVAEMKVLERHRAYLEAEVRTSNRWEGCVRPTWKPWSRNSSCASRIGGRCSGATCWRRDRCSPRC